MRILLVDDNKEVREALRLRFHYLNPAWAVSEAHTLAAAWQVLRAGCVDLLVLDWELPGVLLETQADPAGAAALFTAMRNCCPNLRLIVISAYPDTRRLALQAGGDAFLCKTDPPETIVATVRSVIQPGAVL